MKLTIPYRTHDNCFFTITDDHLLGIYEPNAIDTLFTTSMLEQVLDEGDVLYDFVHGCSSLLVIINDTTRPTPTKEFFKALMPIFDRANIKDDMMTVLVATGAHRGIRPDEYEQLFGPYAQRLGKRLVSHDARDQASLVEFGFTSNGTPISLNKLLFSSDRVIVTGSVEPHYFAGYTGGRKAFLPGIAGYQSIEANHKLALSENAHTLALEGNPVHEDMMEVALRLQIPIYSIMAVLDKDQQIVAVKTGDLHTSFYESIEVAKKIFCVQIPQKADVVVTIAKYPMDIDLYQSQKAIDNGALATKDGGTLILVSSCREGIGGSEFAELLTKSDSLESAIEHIQDSYKLGYHKAAKLAAVMQKINVLAFTDLEESVLASLFINPINDITEAIESALNHAKANGVENPTALVLLDGCVTVPIPALS